MPLTPPKVRSVHHGRGVSSSFALRIARRAAFLASTIALVVAVPHRASAQTSRVALEWTAPASCPDSEAVRHRVLGLVGATANLEARVSVTEASGTFHAALDVRVGETLGVRKVEAASCDALADAVAVVIAMAGTTMSAPPPPTPPPFPAPAPDPTPARNPAPSPNPAPIPPPLDGASESTTPTRPHVRIAVEGSADLGTLPTATVGGRLSVLALPRPDVAVGVAAELWASRSGSPSNLPSQGADFGLISFDALGCYGGLRRHAFELSGCGLVELDRMTTTSFGTSKKADPTAWWVGLGLGLRGRWELTRTFALTAEVDAVLPTARQEFGIAGPGNTTVGTVHVTSLVAGRGHLGGEVRF